MKKPTTNEHYVPQFIINGFSNEKKIICVADIFESTTRFFETTSNNIMFEKDLYETKNIDGTYFERNGIEKKYAKIETICSSKLREILTTVSQGFQLTNKDKEYLKKILSLQLIRTPQIKDIFITDDTNPEKEMEEFARYRMIAHSIDDGIEYLKTNGFPVSNSFLNQFHDYENDFLDFLTSYLEEYYVCIIKAQNSTFFLSDNPVLIDKFPDVKYLYPISAEFAIVVASKFNTNLNNKSLVLFPAEKVDAINAKSVFNSKRFVVFSPKFKNYATNFILTNRK